MSEQLEKYIQIEDDERAGAKKGYVKNQSVARLAADTEEAALSNGESPEEANRKGEVAIGLGIAGEIIKGDVIQKMEERVLTQIKERQNGEPNYGGSQTYADQVLAQRLEPIISGREPVEVRNSYRDFQKQLDQETLDKLRKKIREDKK